MDGLTVAAAVIQFIDFTSRLVAQGVAIHGSQDGLLVGHRELENITEALSESVRDIQQSLQARGSNHELTSVEKEQEKISAEYQSVAKDLLEVLGRLKSKGPKTKWQSIRQALRASWHSDKVEALEKRLDRFRQQMIASLLGTLRNEAEKTAREQASIRLSVEKIEQYQRNSMPIGNRLIQNINEGERWRCDLIRAIHNQPHSTRGVSRFLNNHTPSAWAQAHVNLVREWVLQKIKFRNMTDRERRISKAYERTFKWIFRDPAEEAKPWSNFKTFLKQPSNDIYWITGKPGSGKSTLMKYIRHHRRTRDLLKTWAGNQEIVHAAFYFWNSGWQKQMSVDGLLQTILRECLEKLPSAIEEVLPERWEAASLFDEDDFPWSWEELSDALKRLITNSCPDHKFFIMIDGLDECSGNHSQLIEFILELSQYAENLKLCVASRPWTSFEDAFKGRPHLMLQDLTHADIKHYVNSKFNANQGFSELQQNEPDYAEKLLAQVSAKAEGVFLWVYLVVQSLLEGLTNGDRVRDLERRLAKLPPNLEDLLKKILERLDEHYLAHASQLFQILRASHGSPTLLCVALADLEDADYAMNAPVKPMSGTHQSMLCRAMKRRLASRCRGLLDVSAPSIYDKDTAHHEVQYLHRSVKDFIETPHVWDWILSLNTEPFNPYMALFKSYLIQLKASYPGSWTARKFWLHIQMCIRHAKHGLKAQVDSEEIIRLLGEVDRAATVFTTPSGRQTSPFRCCSVVLENSHWASYFLPHSPSFLYVMTICGIHQYLEMQLHSSDLTDSKNGEVRPPLLFSALETDTVLKHSEFERPHMKAIEVILRKGGDCHQIYQGRSARALLPNMLNMPNISSEREHVYEEIRALFERYKGRPSALAKSTASQSCSFRQTSKAATGNDEHSDVGSIASTEGVIRGTPASRERDAGKSDTRQHFNTPYPHREAQRQSHNPPWRGPNHHSNYTSIPREPELNLPSSMAHQAREPYIRDHGGTHSFGARYNGYYCNDHMYVPPPPWYYGYQRRPQRPAYTPMDQFYEQMSYLPAPYNWAPHVEVTKGLQ